MVHIYFVSNASEQFVTYYLGTNPDMRLRTYKDENEILA